MASRSVSVDLTANPSAFIAGFGRAGVAAEGLDAKTRLLSKNMRLLGGAFIAAEVVKGFVNAAKSAGDFQAQIVRLKTDANETQKNLGMISKGVIALSNATGTSTTDINADLYKIESAGIHGAAALQVAKAAAEGAKVGFADLTTVSDALTTAMTDYHLPAGQAVATTNELIATVSRGKTTLEDLSGSLSKVLPAASHAHLGLAEVLGAMATMTAQGTDAASSATYLRQTIIALSNPLPKARAEMQGLGLDSLDVSKNLGERGLTGTLKILTDAVTSKLGPAGTVVLDTFTKSKGSAKDLQTALDALPPTQQTVIASLADLVGGAKSMQAILQLTGGSAKTFATNVNEIGASTTGASSDVKDWDLVQKNFNQKLAEAKVRFHNLGLVIGQEILPVASKFAGWLGDAGAWLTKYPKLVTGVTYAVAGAGGLILGLKLAAGALNLVTKAMGRSIALRTAMTGGLIAEAGAADKAAAAQGRLAIAEGAGRGGAVGTVGMLSGSALGRSTFGTAVGVTVLNAAELGGALASAAVPFVAAAALGAGAALLLNALGYKPGTADVSGKRNNLGYSNVGAYNKISNPVDAMNAKYYGIQDPAVTRSLAGSDAALSHHAAADAADAVKQVHEVVRAQNALVRANGAADTSWHTVTAAMISNRGELEMARGKMVGLSGATGQLTTHLGVIAKAMQGAKDKASALATGIALLSGNTIDASRAQDGFQQQLNDLSASFDKHTKSLVGSSNAVIQNRGLVDEAAQAAQQHAEAVLKQTGSLDKAKSALDGDAKALQAHLEATTHNKKAADDFLKSIRMMPDQVAAAFDGLHQVGLTYGGALVDGFAGGIQQHMGNAILASQILVDKTKTVFRTGLKIQSPSKVTHQYGGYVATGFANGIKDHTKHAAAAAKALASAATQAMRTEIKDGIIIADRVLSASISTMSKKLTAARTELSNLRSQQQQAMQGAKGVITGTGDLSSIVGATSTTYNWDGTSSTSTAPLTAATLNSGLSAIASKDAEFVRKMKLLHGKKGLKESTWLSIFNLGPDAGMQYADVILSGGQAEIDTVNTLEGGISQSGNQAAQLVGSTYKASIDRQVKATDKLTRELADLKKELRESKNFSLTLNLDKSLAELKRDLAEFERRTGIRLNLKQRTG